MEYTPALNAALYAELRGQPLAPHFEAPDLCLVDWPFWVLERLRERGWVWQVTSMSQGIFVSLFTDDDESDVRLQHPDAPTAIVLAAAAALNVEEK